MKLRRACLLPLVLALGADLLAACSSGPAKPAADQASPLPVALSEDAEVTIGREAHPEILFQYGRYDNEHLQGYVQRVGEDLAQLSARNHLVHRFTVLDSDEVNAFSLPGGYVYVTRGLLAYLNSEAQLAAVLAHEIAHVAARHAALYLAEADGRERYISIGSLIVPDIRGQQAKDAVNTLGEVLVAGYSPERELEADRLATQSLAALGYSPEALIAVLAVLEKERAFSSRVRGDGLEVPISYHGLLPPDSPWELALAEFANQARAGTVQSQRVMEEARFFDALDGVVWGSDFTQGKAVGRQLLLGAWGSAITVPEGWQVVSRRAGAVILSPAADAYIQLSAEDVPEGLTPEAYANAQLGLDNVLGGDDLSVNGLPGYVLIARSRTPYGYRKTKHLVVFVGDKAVTAKVAVQSDSRELRYESVIDKTLKSLRALTPEERIRARQRNLKIIVAGDEPSIGDLAERSALGIHAAEQLRILNHLAPDTEPTPGQVFKTIE
jgi:predicted Zn-dependent protease